MAKKSKSAKNARPKERRERRLLPRASTSRAVVYLVGAVGSMAMGAGAWEQFAVLLREGAPEPVKFAPYVLAAGALLVGVAIWVGTSNEAPLRVGDGGLAVEKGGIRRMPWYAVENVEWRSDGVRVTGKDEGGGSMTLAASLANHGQAAAWIVREARERVPGVVHVPDDAPLPPPLASAGEMLAVEPPQVVGKHCAVSGKVIAYEPDARVCVKCERVYHKAHVPDVCECGASLESLRPQDKTA
jgi:hypothetical protein